MIDDEKEWKIIGKYATWNPPIRERNMYCPQCGKSLCLIEENESGYKTWWACKEHGLYMFYHPYSTFRIEKVR